MRALALAALLFAFPALAQDITDPARVIDGDTIDVAGQRIRLHGIDAPEKNQTCRIEGVPWACGVAAWGELVQVVAGKDVSCETRDVDRYGRAVAVCSADGEDINAAMVAQGWALAYRQFSDDYVTQEDKAQEGRLGMWQGEFVAPWDWHRGARLVAAPAAPNVDQEQNIAVGRKNAAGPCLIKAISHRGVSASITSPAGPTAAPRSTLRRVNVSSVAKPTPKRQDGERRSGSPRRSNSGNIGPSTSGVNDGGVPDLGNRGRED